MFKKIFKKKKKASLTLLFLAIFILFYTLFGIYFNIRASYEFYNRFEEAVQETANYRAQAVDTYLKESFNIIEAFHPTANYEDGDNSDIDHEDLIKNQPQGQARVLSPTDDAYITALENADKSAKELFVELMNLYINNTKTKISPTLSTDNICIQVLPLPETSSNLFKNAEMDFECTASASGVEYDFKKTLTVSTQDNPKLRKFVFDPNNNFGDEDDVYTQVVNVVFVGGVIEHQNLLNNFFNVMSKTFSDPELLENNTTIKGSYAIAYPQSDRCYGEKCSTEYYQDIKDLQ